jgi:hypothetical protein
VSSGGVVPDAGVVPVVVDVPVWLPPLEVEVEDWPADVDVGVDVVGEPVDEPVEEPSLLLVCAVWAGYGSSGAPPLDVELVPGPDVEEGSTVGSDCVWVRPAGSLRVADGVVAVVELWAAAVAGVFAFARALAALTALAVCDLVCEEFGGWAPRLMTD